ncbi:hypothetical protein B9G49_00930 [Halorubrum sp. SD683]|nr:hypothetical protein B9G49_00930 [Halorubrum sp. SD683]
MADSHISGIRFIRRLSRVVDGVGEQFQTRHVDDRLGRHETTVPRRTVRDERITQLTQSSSTSAERSGEEAASEPDTFVVKLVRELQTP